MSQQQQDDYINSNPLEENSINNPQSAESEPLSEEKVVEELSMSVDESEPVLSASQHPIEEEKADNETHGTHSESFQQFLKHLGEQKEPEKKLEQAIHFMETTISQVGSPHFKDFWEVKKICLDLFKEHINASLRVTLWAKYSELCQEARRLKEIFNEQSAFACEQIEMAIKSIEDDIENLPVRLQTLTPLKLSVHSPVIDENYDLYNRIQNELALLSVYATKVNSLRKELIKTEMRIRFKNKFFARLSRLGDAIFPRRKVLIQEISQLFIQDIDTFIQKTFAGELRMTALFHAKDEIKALQTIAKELTLNTEAFSQTRLKLSECWDSIKKFIQERKEGEQEQKTVYREQRDEFMQHLAEIKTRCEEKGVNRQKLEADLETCINGMRKASLGRQEIRVLRDEIKAIQQLMIDKFQGEEKQLRDEAKRVEQEKIDKKIAVEKRLEELVSQAEALDVDALIVAQEELAKAIGDLPYSRAHKTEYEKKLRFLRDRIVEKKENKLLSLSDDDKLAFQQLQSVLKERKGRRQEIKSRIETFRKAQSASGTGFAEALQSNAEMEEEKERLAKIDASIQEVQEKIYELQGKRPRGDK